MRWPWVSRVAHDLIVDESAKRNIDLANRLLITEARCDALLDRLTKQTEPPPPPEPARPDPVVQAILQKAGSDRKLRAHFSQFVTEQRSAGVDDAEIAHAILTGVDDDLGVP